MFKSIVILTGSGISAESGLATFRGKGGLWNRYRVEELATPEAFAQDPQLVQKFYNERRRKLLLEAEPNQAHFSLADFENLHVAKGRNFLLVTQNVDDLHERGGSKNLVHLHGELLKARSVHTGEVVECRNDLSGVEWRPHIVWFGEMPFEMERIYQALEECDLFVAIGTSGHVYPAAGFVETALSGGAHTVEINLESSAASDRFKERISGPATEAVPAYFKTIF